MYIYIYTWTNTKTFLTSHRPLRGNTGFHNFCKDSGQSALLSPQYLTIKSEITTTNLPWYGYTITRDGKILDTILGTLPKRYVHTDVRCIFRFTPHRFLQHPRLPTCHLHIHFVWLSGPGASTHHHPAWRASQRATGRSRNAFRAGTKSQYRSSYSHVWEWRTWSTPIYRPPDLLSWWSSRWRGLLGTRRSSGNQMVWGMSSNTHIILAHTDSIYSDFWLLPAEPEHQMLGKYHERPAPPKGHAMTWPVTTYRPLSLE